MTKIKLSLGVSLWLALLFFMFSIPLWSYSSEKPVSFAFLDDLRQDKAVVFFGFTRCGDVCPASMAVLRQLIKHRNILDDTALPAVIFIDIDRHSSTEQAQTYAKAFDPRFIGINPDDDTLAIIKSQFGLNFVQDGEDIRHRGRTYILEKKSQTWLLVKTINPQSLDKNWLEQELFNT